MTPKPVKKPLPPASLEPIPEPDLDSDAASLAIDDVDDLLDQDDLIAVEEPDSQELSLEEDGLSEMEKEGPFDLLKDPTLVMELSEDPVRLYLREIGEIELLDVDKEFWLATRIEAARRIEALSRAHPLARKKTAIRKGIYQALYVELLNRLEAPDRRYPAVRLCLSRYGVDPG